jgi:hypothetical protein
MARYSLRFLFDPGSGLCFWANNDATREKYGYPVDHDSLPLESQTRTLATNLIARYDTSLNWQDPAGPSPWSDLERIQFESEAKSFLAQVREQLSPEFEVIAINAEYQ